MRSFNRWVKRLFEVPERKIVRYANGKVVPPRVLRQWGLA